MYGYVADFAFLGLWYVYTLCTWGILGFYISAIWSCLWSLVIAYVFNLWSIGLLDFVIGGFCFGSLWISLFTFAFGLFHVGSCTWVYALMSVCLGDVVCVGIYWFVDCACAGVIMLSVTVH